MRTRFFVLIVIFSAFSFCSFGQINKKQLRVIKKQLGNDFSLVIKKVNSDKPIISYNADKSMTPASIVKLITTGVALKELSPSYRFITGIYINGEVKNKSLYGDLLIKGGGDPTIESHYFPENKGLFIKTIIESLKKCDIDTIRGNIVVDASKYGKNGVCKYWGYDDIGNYYGVGAYGFNLYDNYFDLYSEVEDGEVSLLNDKEYDWVVFNNLLQPVSDGRNTDIAFSYPMIDTITLSGNIKCSDMVNLKPAVPNPAKYASIFIKRSISSDIVVLGDALYNYDYHPIDKKNKIGEYLSPELRQIAKITNHASHNMFAEVLSREIDCSKSGKEHIDYEKPISVLSFCNSKIKSSKKVLLLDDACGLSRTDKITARMLCDWLCWVVKDKKISNDFIESLPMAGRTEEKVNTVKSLKTNGRYILKVKSGSMSGVRSYAGVVQYKGNKYTVVFISNGIDGIKAKECFMQFMNKAFK